jgi:arylsulfatase A-like enzyme
MRLKAGYACEMDAARAVASSKATSRHWAARLLPLLIVFAGCGSTPVKPDLILVTVDTLRPDRLAAVDTPNLDRLAARGTSFSQATTPFPRTTPALASLFTGLWPQHHGSREVFEPFHSGDTLAELLRGHGYSTAGVTANSAAGSRQNLDRGFEQFVDVPDREDVHGNRVTEAALRLAGNAPAGKPLFLWVHYMDPHYPYAPPTEFPQPPAPRCRRLMDDARAGRVSKGQMLANRDGISEVAVAECRKLYDTEIAYTDAQIGTLLEGLAALDRLQGAVVAFTSDHGENFGEGGLYYEHGSNLHDAGLRVPLIASRRDDAVIRLEDLMPTLLSLVGVPAERVPRTDGVDVSARLRGESAVADDLIALAESGSALHVESRRAIFSGRARGRHCFNGPRFALCRSPGEAPGLFDTHADPARRVDVSDRHPEMKRLLLEASHSWRPEEPRHRAARTGPFKLVEHPRLAGGHRRALYDLAADPSEDHDVSAAHPEVAARLAAALERWTVTLPAVRAPERDEQQLEALRALGYID